MRSPFTPFGYRELALFGGGLILVTALVPLLLPWPVALIPAALAAFVLSFFRDPERTPPSAADVLAAPADGTVSDIETVASPEFLNEPATRIGIFLSVFNVHVNRSPVQGVVRYARYQPGRFLDARDARAGTQNEAQVLGLEAGPIKLLVRQVAGLIARRIVCPVAIGTVLQKGQRYGMIKFGSRTELYLPRSAGVEVLVQVGQKVFGGATPVARIAALSGGRDDGALAATTPMASTSKS